MLMLQIAGGIILGVAGVCLLALIFYGFQLLENGSGFVVVGLLVLILLLFALWPDDMRHEFHLDRHPAPRHDLSQFFDTAAHAPANPPPANPSKGNTLVVPMKHQPGNPFVDSTNTP